MEEQVVRNLAFHEKTVVWFFIENISLGIARPTNAIWGRGVIEMDNNFGSCNSIVNSCCTTFTAQIKDYFVIFNELISNIKVIYAKYVFVYTETL